MLNERFHDMTPTGFVQCKFITKGQKKYHKHLILIRLYGAPDEMLLHIDGKFIMEK
jgi:hypothetical protein